MTLADLIDQPISGYWGRDHLGLAAGLGVRVVRNGDISEDRTIRVESLPIRWFTQSEFARARVLPDDTLVVSSGYVGKSGSLGFGSEHTSVAASNFVRIVRPKGGVHPRWLYWLLGTSSAQREMLRHSGGTTIANLSSSFFRDYVVPYVPGLADQRVIAEVLDTIDEAIRRTELLVAKLKRIKQGMLHDLLTRGVDDNGELRDPQRHPERFRVSLLGSLPTEWEVATIGSLCRRVTYGFTNPMPTTRDGPFMLTAADVGFDQVLWSNARRTSEVAFRRLTEKSRPDPGDILVTKDGTLGRVAVLDRPDVCVNQSVAVLKPRRDVLARYLATYLISVNGQRRLLADAGGSTIGHIYISTLAKMQVPVPPDAEAYRLAEIAHEAEERVRREAAFADKLMLLKRGLMEDLLAGSVRATPLQGGNAA